MAFFEDLGKKISQTSQGVMQKTKDTSEVIKLNSAISDEEKAIKNCYLELGKKYFELHNDSCESDFQGIIDAIKNSLLKIKECNERIQVIKGVAVCPNCGKEIPNGTTFCSFCGSKVEKAVESETAGSAETPAVKTCPNCNETVADGCAFCIKCGTKL